MITYNVERWNDMFEEFKPFVEPHWKELGIHTQDIECVLDWERYKELDNKGCLKVITVRDDGVLIGYHISIVTYMLHYATTLHAVVDLYYLKPEYRKSKIGLGMFQYAEMHLASLGCKKLINGTKLHLNHEKMFTQLGYEAFEVLYYKTLTPPALNS